MDICDTIEQRIAAEGVEFLQADAAMARHAASCPRCSDLIERLAELDANLGALPVHDAADGLVGRVIQQISETEPVTVLSAKRRWVRGLSTAAVLVITFGVLSAMFVPAYQSYRRTDTTEADLPLGVTNVAEELREKKGLAEEVARLAQSEQLVANVDTLVSGAASLGSKQDGDGLTTGFDRDRLSRFDRERNLLAELVKDYRSEPEGFERQAGPREKEGALAVIEEETAAIAGGYAPQAPAESSETRKNELVADEDAGTATPTGRAARLANSFLVERERLTDLEFKPVSGYWANTYVPGDASIRYLESQLGRWANDGTALGALNARLVQTVMPNRQPFDAPRRASLDVFMHADKTSIDGPARLRVQIGIRAADRKGGHRPSMNIAVVVDTRTPLDATTRDKVSAMLRALGGASQPGDNISLLAPGDKGLLIAPGEFRHGTIEVALGQLFGETDSSPTEAVLSLRETIGLAARQIETSRSGPGALGTNLVLLVSGSMIGAELAGLEAQAHRNALHGIGLSVVSLGGSADLTELDSLVLLGQGHRRIITAADDARAVIENELRAASRAVARAVRLRIRLAEGVRLVDVLGSHSLEDGEAERVREAENSIDQTLSRELGIEADRGEDEDGIQIVIPSFYAGDSHVILLDIVVNTPGPVADITIRYKDLLERENGVARANLSVASANRAPGLLELNVLKNHVTYLVTESARRAGQAIARGDLRAARTNLDHMRLLVQGLRGEVPAWRDNGELLSDEDMLAAFVAVLTPHVVAGSADRQRLVDSLAYVAARRLLPAYEPER